MSTATRRRTDPRSDAQRLAEMSSEERQAAYLYRLSTDVRAACCAFLKSRQLPIGDEASWRGINARLRDSNATSEATGGKGRELGPGGCIESPQPSDETPRRVALPDGAPFSLLREIPVFTQTTNHHKQ